MRRVNRIAKTSEKPITERYNVKVGDIFHGTWGYDMTIPEFYQVTKVTKASVKLRRLSTEVVSGGGYAGILRAIPNVFADDCFNHGEFTCRVKDGWHEGVPMVHVKHPDVYCHRVDRDHLTADYNRMD